MTLPRTSARTCLVVLTFFVWIVCEPNPVPAQSAGTVGPGVLPGQAGCSLLCQDVTVSAPGGQCSEVVNYPLPTPSGQCSGVIQCTPPSGSPFGRDTTTVNCSATDASGNSGVCDFDVALAAQSVLEVPTASPLGLALFALMVGAVALLMLRRP